MQEKKPKSGSNVAKDALIALSSLNHDFFITADRCLFRSWKKVVEFNEGNERTLEQNGYKLPKLIQRRKPKGILQAKNLTFRNKSHTHTFSHT